MYSQQRVKINVGTLGGAAGAETSSGLKYNKSKLKLHKQECVLDNAKRVVA
jgi:hypothetical protein